MGWIVEHAKFKASIVKQFEEQNNYLSSLLKPKNSMANKINLIELAKKLT